MNKTKLKSQSFILAACFMLLFGFNGFAQQANNTQSKEKVHSPKKAVILSTVLPGAGQVYNKKWWKIPIIYTGIGVSAYAANWNRQQYQIYSDAFDQVEAGEPLPEDHELFGLTSVQLIEGQNFYSKNREISIFVGVGFYLLNILDAAVDAHLYEFDVSDDLSLKIEPAALKFNSALGMYNGVNLTLKF